MTNNFKPGDIVRPIATQTVQSVERHRLGDILSFSDGWGAATDYEIATPSVSVIKLREVLTELRRNNEPDANREQMSAWNAALEAFFLQLTGERP